LSDSAKMRITTNEFSGLVFLSNLLLELFRLVKIEGTEGGSIENDGVDISICWAKDFTRVAIHLLGKLNSSDENFKNLKQGSLD